MLGKLKSLNFRNQSSLFPGAGGGWGGGGGGQGIVQKMSRTSHLVSVLAQNRLRSTLNDLCFDLV